MSSDKPTIKVPVSELVGTKTIPVTFYVDVWPGCPVDDFVSVSTNPSTKSAGVKRYAVTVHIPDPAQPDAELDAHDLREVDGDINTAGGEQP